MPASKSATKSSASAAKVVRRRKAPAAESAAAPAPAVNEPVVAASVAASAADQRGDEVEQLLSELNTQLEEFRRIKQTLADLSRDVLTRYETVARTASRVLKRLNKKRRTRVVGERKPSGFQSPIEITAELCRFLKCETGTKVSRMEVTRMINKYIKEHNLQDPADKRNINPDATLRTLLRIGADDGLTYFNLQSKMNHLFIKADAQTAWVYWTSSLIVRI